MNYKFCYKEIIDVLDDKTVFNWYHDFNRGEDTFKDDDWIRRSKSLTDDFYIKKPKNDTKNPISYLQRNSRHAKDLSW